MELTFENAFKALNEISNDLHCFFTLTDRSEYGFKQMSLETDKFGCCAVNIHYDINTGVFTDWIHSSDERILKSISDLKRYATSKVRKMQKVRNADDLYDFIDSQY